MAWESSTDIFGRLDWLGKKVKNVLGRVYNLEQNTISAGVDANSNGVNLTVNYKSIGPKVVFTKTDGGSEVDTIIPGGLALTRGNQGGLFNAINEQSYVYPGPSDTEWNSIFIDEVNYGWHKLATAPDREFNSWLNAVDGNAGKKIVGLEMLLRFIPTGRLFMIKFTDWTNGIGEEGQGGGFSYERYEILAPVLVERADEEDDFADVIEPGKTIIKRDSYPSDNDCIGGGIYNSAVETFYNSCLDLSPINTEWNSEYTDSVFGFTDLTNVQTRQYSTFRRALSNNVGNNILSTELVMHDLSTDLYWSFQFTDWTTGSNGGGMSYTRTLIPTDQGIRFPDGTFMNTATSSGPVVDSSENLIIADSSNNLIAIGPGGTHNIPNFSGMVLVNDHYDGSIEMWICGGGGIELISRTNVGPGAGTIGFGPNNGYTWTNISNQQGPFTFTVIKTRNGS